MHEDQPATRFRELVVPHLQDALMFARGLTGNRDDAEDVVQEACLRAYAATGRGTVRHPRAWLLAIVRNTAFTWMAKNRPKAVLALGDDAEIDRLAETADAASTDTAILTPEAELIRKAEAAAVQRAVDALPALLREVLVLREFNELSYREIADLLSLPIGTVMSRLSRARLMLAISIAEAHRD
ncbi:sigma-70 family RNA polymerase sigma factor [Mycoplana dimorpha]|uniref:RNA polymerase sigma factor n=1 Tax=Mycoplana dimorpha TaxID=28320 RepID=A0A2T5B8Q2_MYCDI|nr:sigma-70 family RNA polymerase sigma factor [Mycoplana dimorpha]PTM95283.1 RNA polymerase sigma-70 factor (ECF subfamily) [Mycoplana dimorpha]